MILESVQLLSTACRLSGIDQGYKITHINHPCSIWVRKSLSNWKWLKVLVCCLNEEFKFRYGNVNHKSFEICQELLEPEIKDIGLTPFALAMPDYCKKSDPVDSYRNYYIQEKKFAKWTKREKPYWFI